MTTVDECSHELRALALNASPTLAQYRGEPATIVYEPATLVYEPSTLGDDDSYELVDESSVLSRTRMYALIRELVHETSETRDVTDEALVVLHEAAENYLIELFTRGAFMLDDATFTVARLHAAVAAMARTPLQ